MLADKEDKSLLFVVSGPAGSGKTTLCDKMLEHLYPKVQRVITSTTRKPREGEVDGVDYHFFSKEDFEKRLEQGAFYEHALVHGNYYGSLKEDINGKLLDNVDLLLNIDVQGAMSFKRAAQTDGVLRGRLVTIFVMPPSIEELRKRLMGRGKDSEGEIESRLVTAMEEVGYASQYDYCLPSHTEEEDFVALLSIYTAEKLKYREPTEEQG